MSDCGQLFRKVSLDFLWEVMQRQPRDISCGVSIEIYKTDGTFFSVSYSALLQFFQNIGCDTLECMYRSIKWGHIAK